MRKFISAALAALMIMASAPMALAAGHGGGGGGGMGGGGFGGGGGGHFGGGGMGMTRPMGGGGMFMGGGGHFGGGGMFMGGGRGAFVGGGGFNRGAFIGGRGMAFTPGFGHPAVGFGHVVRPPFFDHGHRFPFRRAVFIGFGGDGGYYDNYYPYPYYGYGYGYGYNTAYYHTAACAARYRSYNPATNTFVGYDGRVHSCVL